MMMKIVSAILLGSAAAHTLTHAHTHTSGAAYRSFVSNDLDLLQGWQGQQTFFPSDLPRRQARVKVYSSEPCCAPTTRILTSRPRILNTRIVRVPALKTPVVYRMSTPREKVHYEETTTNRVLRTPISKTVTELPSEVTRIKRNINTHMPMIHKRIKNHYSIEDVNKKDIVHHYVSPVENKFLGTRAGVETKGATEHVLHKSTRAAAPQFLTPPSLEEELPPSLKSLAQQEELIPTGGVFWKIKNQETCGKCSANFGALNLAIMIRPACACVTNQGFETDESQCSSLAFPNDMTCGQACNGNVNVQTFPSSNKFWQVLEGESCLDIPAGQPVRPKALCMSQTGEELDAAECNELPFPADITC